MGVGSARAASRLALVVGNAAYAGAPLPTSANDAGLVAQTLAAVGFDVTAMANTTRVTLGQAVQAFEAKAKDAGPDATIVVYLAGRGVQVDGENFLVPIDAKIARGADVATQAMRLSDLTTALDATAAKTRIVIYDLARSNAFAREDGMPLAGGLALVAAPKGALYAFNAAPGTVARADLALYGAYARALCEMIQTPGLSPAALFARVRLRAGELTDGAVIPWADAATDDTPLVGTAASSPPAAAETSAKLETLDAAAAYSVVVARDTLQGYLDFLRVFPRDPLSPRVAFIAAAKREALFWAAAARANEPRALWTYMRHYPRGAHYYDARRRLAALAAPLEPPPRFDIESFPDLPPPSREEAAAIDRPDLSFDDPYWENVPAPPPAMLPPATPAFYEDLPPPPLGDPLVLAIPAPVPLVSAGPLPAFGHITQPAIGERGALRTETTMKNAATTTTTMTVAGGTIVSRLVATIEPGGRRAIVQTGPDQAVVARTIILRDAAGSTVVQTGAAGGVLTKSVTSREPDGSMSTLLRDAADRVIFEVRRNRAGIVVSAQDLAVPRVIHHSGLTIPIPPAPAKARAAPAPAIDPHARVAPPPDMGKPRQPEPKLDEPTTPPTGAALPRIGPTPPPRPRATPQKTKPTSRRKAGHG